MANGQADVSAPLPSTSRSRTAAGSVGVLLDGRYRLLQRRTRDGAGATWDGEDDQLLRAVVIHVVAGPTAAEAVDAARRSAAVEDDRLPHLLDVGLERAVDGTALGWVVTERAPGRSLAELLREAPLPPARARALVGEAAALLALASRSGLHHRRLEPGSVLLTADGGVSVLGLEVAAAAAGAPQLPPAASEREDAEGLVRLLYAALTGLWPAGRCGALGAAPTGRGGAPVAPGQLAAGVPSDLDAVCAAVLGPYREGPRTPAEVAAALTPWGSSTGPVTRTGLGITVEPAWQEPGSPHGVRPPTAADVAGAPVEPGSWATTPVRARLGGGPGLHFAAGAAGGAGGGPGGGTGGAGAAAADDGDDRASARQPVDPARRPRQLTPSVPSVTSVTSVPAEGVAGTRALRRPTVAVPPGAQQLTPSQQAAAHEAGGAHETRASRRAAQRRAERDASGHDAFDELLGPVTGPGSAVAAAPTRRPAPAAAPATQRPGRTSPFDDTDATDWVDAGWGPAPAGARPVTPRRPRPGDVAARGAAPHGGTRRARRGLLVGVAVAAVVGLAGTAAAVVGQGHLAGLAGALGIDTATDPAPGTSAAAAAPGAAVPAAGAEGAAGAAGAAGGADGAGRAPVAQVTGATAVDPFGDGTENDAAAPRAVDGDRDTAWVSSTYRTAALGNLKRGVGLGLVLGDGDAPSTVTSLSVRTQGTGGVLQVRSSPDGGYQGSTVVATTQAGTGGRAVDVDLDEPVTTGHLLLWFTELPLTPSGYTAVVNDVTAR